MLNNKKYNSSFSLFNSSFQEFIAHKNPEKASRALAFQAIIQTIEGDYFGSEKTSTEALNLIQKSKISNDNLLVSIYNQIALNKEYQKDFASSTFWYELAEKKNKDPYNSLVILNNIAVGFYEQGKYDKAIIILKKINSKKIDSLELKARIIDNLSYVMFLKNKNYKAEKGLFVALKIREKEHGFYGGHGIVGAQIPVGAGMAFADKYFETGGVTLTYFGDGAARQGSLHEAFNMAMLWKLPVVFICENNGYAMGTSVERTANHTDIWKLGLGYEMPCGPVDGMNPVKVAEAMHEAMERARRGDGPTFLEMKTYRYRGHSMSDAQHYRTKEEVEEYRKIDPITQVLDVIKENNYASEAEIEAIDQRVNDLVAECEKFAEESPFPEAQQLYDVVYDQENYPFIPHRL
jgi:pyruvate dehydrogenase E1 component alpha subunit